MADYNSTSDFLDAIKGQVESALEADVDAVFRFLGRLDTIVSQVFKQASGGGVNTAIGITLSTGTATNTVAGVPLRLNELVTMYVITRARAGDYDNAVAHVLDVVDELTYSVFDCDKWRDDYTDMVVANAFQSREHVIPASENLIVYRVDWQISPRRT